MAAPRGRISSKMPHDDWVRCFDVSDPQTHDKGYTVYKVTYKIFSRKTAELTDEILIWKRYNDFKKLHKILSEWHRKLQRREEFPLFARSKVFGRFEDAVIEERRQSAFDLLAFAGCQYHLYNHKAFKAFFEGGQHVNPDADISAVPAMQPERAWSRDLGMSRDESRDSLATDASETDSMDGARCSDQKSECELGGVWQYRQANDNVSLESAGTDHDRDHDDDDTSYTDDSALTTPLPDNDLTFFDPLPPKHAQTLPNDSSNKANNTWLLSAMSICAELDSNSATPSPVHKPKPETGESGECRTESEVESESKSEGASGGMKLSATMEEIANRTRAGTGDSVSKMDIGGSDDYIYQAAQQISMARDCEANAQYSLAFEYYKTGVGILLTGVQDDSNKARREAVRKKTAQYLLKAEDMHNTFLRTSDDQVWTAEVRVSPYRSIDPSAAFLQGSVSELANYRVLGVIDNVMLVLDKNTENTYIMKTLHKSSGAASQNRTILPQNVPYMVKLYRFYDTDSAIYLLLQHATGGKLWNYISAYLNNYNDDNRTGLGDGMPKMENIYAGQKLQSQETELIEKAERKILELESKRDHDNEFERSDEYHAIIENFKRDMDLEDLASPSDEVYGHGDDTLESDIPVVMETLDDHGENGDTSTNFESELEEQKNAAKPSLFSIASVDSSDAEHHTSVSSETEIVESSQPMTRLELQDIPENDAISDNIIDIDEHGLPSTDELVHNAKKLLQSVSQTLSEHDVEGEGQIENELSHDAPDVVRSAMMPRRSSTPSDDVFRTSSILGVEISTQQQTNSPSSSEGEECIYDLNGQKSPKISPEKQKQKNSPSKTPPIRSPTRTTFTPPVQRKRNFSHVFRDFDDLLSRTNTDVKMPEVCVKQWAAEVLVALDRLHACGIICRDLNPTNILLGDRGHVMLSYFSEWTNVHRRLSQDALNYNYCAPEVRSFYNVEDVSCDWWSFGAILYELLTCKSLYSCHTSGISSHTQLVIPDHVSAEAQHLLRQLLRYNPQERLGSGLGGPEDIRHHPFFYGVDWAALQAAGQ